MEIIKLRGNVQNGSFRAGFGVCYYGGIQTGMSSLKQGSTHYGFTASLTLYLKKTNDHEGEEFIWAVMNSEMVNAILYKAKKSQATFNDCISKELTK